MRKIGRLILSAVLVTAMICTVTACGLSGTYAMEKDGAEVAYTFDNGELTMSAMGMDIHGKYSVDGDEISMTMTVFGIENTQTYSFRQEGSSIFIDGVEYRKK